MASWPWSGTGRSIRAGRLFKSRSRSLLPAQDGDFRSGDFGAASAGANLYYTFAWTHWVKPFVGVARYEVNRIGFPGGAFAIDDSDTTVIGMLHAGLDFPLAPQFTATVRYTAAFIPELNFASSPPGITRTVDSTINSIISVGGRYSFN